MAAPEVGVEDVDQDEHDDDENRSKRIVSWYIYYCGCTLMCVAWLRMRMRSDVRVDVRVDICVCMHACVCVCMCAYVCMRVHACTNVYAGMRNGWVGF